MKKKVIRPVPVVLFFIFLAGITGFSYVTKNKQADAAATNILGLQLRDDNCGGSQGSARYTTSVGTWTPWAGDSDDYDPDCIKAYLGSTVPSDLDIRLGIQAQDINTPCGFLWLFKCGDGGGTVRYTSWATESGDSWSSWASDVDMMDPDQWRLVIETRPLYGYSVDFKVGYQLGDGGSNVYSDGGGCTYQTNPTYYTGSSTEAAAWGEFATDNDFNCVKINFLSTTTLNDPTAQFIGTSSAPAGNSINLPYDVEYINTSVGCTLVGRNGSNVVVDDRSAYPITANGINTTSTIAITEATTYTLTCTGFKTGTTAIATKTIVPISQPAQLSFKMSPTSGISPGDISTATIAATNASSCTLKGYDVNYNVVDVGYTFTPPPPSATLPYSGPTVTETIFLTSGTSWTVPSNWNSSNNSVEVIGAGGGGSSVSSGAGYGGGGGAYAKVTNVSLTPGASVTYQVGAAGAVGAKGGDTYFNGTGTLCSSQTVCAKGGLGGPSGPNNGATTTPSIGTTKYSGGNGGALSGDAGAGGGGAGGPNGNGAAGGAANTTQGGGGGASSGGNSGSAATASVGGNGGNAYGGATWTQCASENGTCSFSGTKYVAYGANTSFNYGTYTTSVACTNAVFGDPISGTAKNCYYTSTLGATYPGTSSGGTGGNGANGGAGSYGGGGGGGDTGRTGGAGGAGAEWKATNTWNGSAYSGTTPSGGAGGGGGGAGHDSNAGVGGTYGGGGGSKGNDSNGAGATGGAGLIVVAYTYIPTVTITLTSGTSWLVPDDWGTVNTIEVIGGGAGGNNRSNRGGGGGGAYSKITNTTAISPGRLVTYAIGSGGAAGVAGGDTYLCSSLDNCTSITGSAVVVGAKGGSVGSGTSGGAGGSASSGYPAGASCTVGAANIRCSGGNGGNSGSSGSDDGPGGAGGGGAAGPNGAGKNGGSSSGHDEGSGGGGNSGGANGSNSDSYGGCWLGCGGVGGSKYSGGSSNCKGSGTGAGGGGCGGDDSRGGHGSDGGGGGGGDDDTSNPRGGAGGNGSDINGTIGSGGGGGGAGQNQYSSIGGNGGLYGGGGGGEGYLTGATPGNGGSGAQGVIYITYTPNSTVLTDNTESKTSEHVVNVTTNFVVSCVPYDGSNTIYATSTVTMTSCMLDGVSIPDGSPGVNFYSVEVAPTGHVCSEYIGARSCSAGTLTGTDTFVYASCAEQNDISITANGIASKTSVRKGSSVALSWDGGNAESCTVTGSDGWSGADMDGITATSSTKSVIVNQKTVYTAECILGGNTKRASVTVNILPTFINF